MLKKWLTFCLAVLFGGAAGFFAAKHMTPESGLRGEQGSILERESGHKFVNPLLDCGVEYVELSPLRAKILELTKKEKEANDLFHVSVYFRHLNNGYWFGINERDLFTPASLLKVPIMMAALKNVEIDPSVAQKKAVFRASNPRYTQNITMAERLKPGVAYTLGELVERMIVDSDNDALSLLTDMIDPAVVDKVFTDLGLEVLSESGADNMSIRAYATFFRILYNASYLNTTSSEYALFLLSKTKFNDGIVAGVGPGLNVAHKFGERDTMGILQLHDCGVVYYEKDPYLLCLMTRGKEFKDMTRAIQNISRAVHREVVRQVEERRR